MKNLVEIKDDYAKELGWDSFSHLLLDIDGTREMLDRDYNEVAKRYAQSVAEDLRKRIIQNCQPKWIKINSEADLPKHSVWLSNKTDVWQGKLFIPDTKTRVNLLATHYAPITKPQPPKED